jgi:hypothetical protein
MAQNTVEFRTLIEPFFARVEAMGSGLGCVGRVAGKSEMSMKSKLLAPTVRSRVRMMVHGLSSGPEM